MAQPVAKYNGDFITCYPGSNQLDEGKLNLEKNMARIVTRLSSKNFCIVKPSFEIEKINNVQTGAPQLRVLPGQASINGMDIIAEDSLVIDPPEKAGTYHLALKLARDSSWNVLGDFVYGDTTTFEGVYLSYFADKPDPIDPDMLYLGQITWDGSSITKVVEDQDKYGRIWAEDILCKLNDPKHPDITRLTLQDWIYKVPDWYVSKEGDVIYGALDFLPGRNGNNQPGVSIVASDNNNSSLIIKAPGVSKTDKSALTLSSNSSTSRIKLGNNEIYTTGSDWSLHLVGTESIFAEFNKKAWLWGREEVQLLTNSSGFPNLTLKGTKLSMDWGISGSTLSYNIDNINNNIIQETVGKAKWQYNDETNKLILLNTDVDYLDIIPNSDFQNKLRVRDRLLLGNKSTYGNETTYLTEQLWRIADSNNSKYISIAPDIINIVNPSLSSSNNSIINLRNSNDTIHTKIFDNGKIELLNTTENPGIRFYDGTATNTSIWKVKGEKKIQVEANLGVTGNVYSDGSVTGKTGIITENRVITFRGGTSEGTITKDEKASTLRTNGAFYVGSSGQSDLFAGDTTIKGSATIGSSGQCVIYDNGNIDTDGTITGTKVYNAVYNDYAEIMKKPQDEIIEPGDLVYVREDGLICKVTSSEHFNSIIGICSDTAGVILGGDGIPEEERVIVGFVGQIWTKTNEEEIRPGQMLKINDEGTLSITTDRSEKFAIALTPVREGKVRVLYNG